MKTKVLTILCAAFLAVAMGSCMAGDKQGPCNNNGGLDGNMLSITLRIPGLNTYVPANRAMNQAQENNVVSIDLLVFGQDGKFAYTFRSTDLKPGSAANEMICKVQVKDNPEGEKFTLVFLANLPAAGDRSIAELVGGFAGLSKEEVLKKIKFDTDGGYYDADGKWIASDLGAKPFPMWGERSEVRIGTGTKLSGIEIVRAVARIDVGLKFSTLEDHPDNYGAEGLGEESGIPNFEIVSVQVRNVRTRGYVAPLGTNWTSDPKLPSVADLSDADIKDMIEYKDEIVDGKQLIREIYIAESDIKGTADPKDMTCLLIEGKYKGRAATWYRVDLYERDNKDEPRGTRLNILRNHRYIINITGVNGDGYPDVITALDSDPMNLVSDVLYWNTEKTDPFKIDGQNFLYVTPREFSFGAAAVPTNPTPAGINELEISTNVADGWKVEGGTSGITYPSGTGGWLTLSSMNGTALPSEKPAQVVKLTTTANTGVERTAKFYIAAGRMRMPVTVTQAEAPATPILTVTGPAEYNYKGESGNKNYSVVSYKKNAANEEIPVPWTAEFSTDGGATWTATKPDWLTTFTTSGSGNNSDTPTYYAATVQAFAAVYYNAEDITLRDKTPALGSEGAPYDLSKRGTTVVNTANCYVINAPGVYMLPLVYGNAIKNGAVNIKAYSTTVTGTKVLQNFKRHDDQPITGPYIYNQFTPNDATIVWMDAPGLIDKDKVQLTGDRKSLTFEVPQANIRQGNAIVAVRDASNILWSWHIWVTPTAIFDAANPQVDVTTLHSSYFGRGIEKFSFMKYNLGWCTGRDDRYGAGPAYNQPRTVLVRIKQTDIVNPQSAEPFPITQTPYSEVKPGNNPYWQWGRKDPMPPLYRTATSSTTEKPLYDGTYAAISGPVPLGLAIRNPNIFYMSNGNWCSTNYSNLWSTDNTLETENNNSSFKTVYDPSPVGFKMPASAAWTGFSTVGGGFGLGYEYINGEYITNEGWKFYLDGWLTGNKAFYPMTDYRGRNIGGGGSVDRNSAAYWTNTPNFTYDDAYCLYFKGSILNASSPNGNANGYSVRSVKEE